MIDDSLRIAPDALTAASGGDTTQVQAVLVGHGIDAASVSLLLDALTAPFARLEVLRADRAGLVRQRAHLGAVGILHADGDDRTTSQPAVVAPSAVELVHVVLDGLGLGPRPVRPSAEPTEDGTVHLDRVEQAMQACLGETDLPDGAQPISADTPAKWWALRWDADADPAVAGQLAVLDTGQLWEQRDTALVPTDAVALLGHLIGLLSALSDVPRPTVTDEAGGR